MATKSSILAACSTSTPLAASAVYTATSTDITQAESIHVFIKTDQSCTLYMEFSTDNSNWDDSIPYTISGVYGGTFRSDVHAQYFRVRLINGPVAQTLLRMQTVLYQQELLNAILPATLGQKAMAASLACTIASDQAAFPVSITGLPVALGVQNRATSLGVSIASDCQSLPTSNATQLTAALGQAVMTASLPVVIASNQSAVSTTDTRLPSALGQTTMAASLPVALASNQSALATSNATQLPAALGQAVMTASLPVVIASNQSAISTTDTRLPSALGSAASAACLPVVIASDQAAVPVSATLLDIRHLTAANDVITAESSPSNSSLGCVPYYSLNGNTTGQNVAAGPLRLYSLHIGNNDGAAGWLKLYNVLTPTSASTPVAVFRVAAGASTEQQFPTGLYFSTELSFRVSGAPADNDGTAMTANTCVCTFVYRA